MAKKRILTFKAWLWSSVIGVMGLCMTGCPCNQDDPVVLYGPPVVLYGPPPVKSVLLEQPAILPDVPGVVEDVASKSV